MFAIVLLLLASSVQAADNSGNPNGGSWAPSIKLGALFDYFTGTAQQAAAAVRNLTTAQTEFFTGDSSLSTPCGYLGLSLLQSTPEGALTPPKQFTLGSPPATNSSIVTSPKSSYRSPGRKLSLTATENALFMRALFSPIPFPGPLVSPGSLQRAARIFFPDQGKDMDIFSEGSSQSGSPAALLATPGHTAGAQFFTTYKPCFVGPLKDSLTSNSTSLSECFGSPLLPMQLAASQSPVAQSPVAQSPAQPLVFPKKRIQLHLTISDNPVAEPLPPTDTFTGDKLEEELIAKELKPTATPLQVPILDELIVQPSSPTAAPVATKQGAAVAATRFGVYAGLSIAAISVLYAFIQSITSHTKRKAATIALQRIFGKKTDRFNIVQEKRIKRMQIDLLAALTGLIAGSVGAVVA